MALNTSPAPLPWYRTFPILSGLTKPRVKKLRPQGHHWWVEALQEPILVIGSGSFALAGLYNLAISFIQKAFTAIGAGDKAQLIPLALALFVILVTSAIIEFTFLVGAARVRMHFLRREWAWFWPAVMILLFTILVEGTNGLYMFYQLEHPALPGFMQQIMDGMPILQFCVRAFAALICMAYVIIFVMPYEIRPDDVRREIASKAGAAKVAITQRVLDAIGELSLQQLLLIWEPVSALFRESIILNKSAQASKLAAEALQVARERLLQSPLAQLATTNNVNLAALLDAELMPMQKAYAERAGVADLAAQDEQTLIAFQHLRERMQDEAVTVAATEAGVTQDAFNNLLADIALMRDQMNTPTTSISAPVPDLAAHIESAVAQLTQQFESRLDHMREQFEVALAAQPAYVALGAGEDGAVISNSVATSVQTNRPKQKPIPGSPRYNKWVYDQAQSLYRTKGNAGLNFDALAEATGDSIDDLRTALAAYQKSRVSKLRGNDTIEPDAVLDTMLLDVALNPIA